MDSLATLIKLLTMRVDEQRQLLAKLQAHLDDVEASMAELEARKKLEQETVRDNPDIALTYGDFVQWALGRKHELEKQHAVARQAVDLAHNKLAELFEEQKRYELAQANRETALLRDEERRDRTELDEVGSVGFMRSRDE